MSRPIDHADYADEAESASRAGAWPQAAALYRRAADVCPDAVQAAKYRAQAAEIDQNMALDARLAEIAKRVLGIPTLDARRSDRLDIHEVSVWGLKRALREAYRAGKNEAQP